jgi:hypothetical protein
VIWYDPGASHGVDGDTYASGLTQIGTFRTVEEFWRYWNHIDLQRLPKFTNISVFREGVMPTWEDPANVHGGRWIVRGFNKAKSAECFTGMVLALVATQFSCAPELTGVVYAARPKGNVASLWSRRVDEALFEPVDTELREVLHDEHLSLDVEYRAHVVVKDTPKRPSQPEVLPTPTQEDLGYVCEHYAPQMVQCDASWGSQYMTCAYGQPNGGYAPYNNFVPYGQYQTYWGEPL